MNARGLFSRVMLGFAPVLACVLVLCGTALAKPGFIPAGSFSPTEKFAQPYGIAVDNSVGLLKGDVYVTDRGADKVYDFASNGTVRAEASLPGVTLGQLAVAEAGAYAGYVYVAGENSGVIYRFAPGLASREEVITGLGEPSGVAMDTAGSLFVAEASAQRVLEFDAAGQPIDPSGAVVGTGENTVAIAKLKEEEYAEPNVPQLLALAVDPDGSSLYAAGAHVDVATNHPQSGEVFKYSLSGGAYVADEPLEDSASNVAALAVGPTGEVYVLQHGQSVYEVFVLEPSGGLITKVWTAELGYFPRGVAVNTETGNLYSAGENLLAFERGERPKAPMTEAYSGLNGSFVTLNGTLEGGETEYYFEYNVGSDCEGGQRTATVAASGVQQVHLEVGELARLTKYSYCLVSTDKYGSEPGTNMSFETGNVQPVVSGEAVSSVATRTATVDAQVDPEGIPTTYYFEYGPSTSYGSKTSQFGVGGGEAPVSVSAPLTGLEPGATYHLRVVAANSAGSTRGADITFATYSAALSGLPDDRLYEMVTPVFNPFDMNVYEATSGLLNTTVPFESSADGNAVVYAGFPSSGGTGSSGLDGGQQYRATRSPAGGWIQSNITPSGNAPFVEYAGFSSNLSTGFIPLAAEPPLRAAEVLTLPTNEEKRFSGFYETKFGENIYRPLFTVAPLNRHEEAISILGTLNNSFELEYAGASNEQVFFEANDDLVEGGGALEGELASVTKHEGELMKEATKLNRESKEDEKRDELEAESNNFELYESAGGHVRLVNVLPNGKLAPGATFGSARSRKRDIENSRSRPRTQPDFSNVISADGSRVFWSSATVFHQFTSEPGVVYVREDGSRTVQVSAGPAMYWTASADGRYAYYIEGGDLWRFDVEHETREQVTTGKAGVRAVIGVNQTGEDGADVYFVALGALTDEENAAKQKPLEGENNLYVSVPDPDHPGGHVIRFIATLSFEDESDWALSLGVRTAQVAPDGQSVVFESTSNLTGHTYPGEGSEEIYDYGAGEGRLICASCRPQASGGFFETTSSSTQTRRWVSADGDRVFFESEAPLVLQDTNGARDVYEWEPDGSGGCAETEGCVYLLSGGLETTAFLADASVSGNDVFIATRQRLLPEDQNEYIDLYDARVDGALAVSPPECTGTACQGTPAATPIFATPASVTFAGVGNFPSPGTAPAAKTKAKALTRAQKLARAIVSCHRKRKRKQRHVCETKARRLYEATTKKKARK